MVIQAGAARWLAEKDPVKAEGALDSVDRAAQEALRELNSLVGSLGSFPLDRVALLPAADYLSIPSLVDQAVRDGMRAELVIRGQPRELDAGLGKELDIQDIIRRARAAYEKA